MPAIIIIIMLIELLNNNGILLNIAVCASAVLSANTVPFGPYNCLMTSSFVLSCGSQGKFGCSLDVVCPEVIIRMRIHITIKCSPFQGSCCLF